ncbi:hypothetical protein JXO52_08795 [bacterium]|nr:hypothetical protein [bacterium]
MRPVFLHICLAALLCLNGTGNACSGTDQARENDRLDNFNRKIVHAVRYGNAARMVSLLQNAYESGAIPNWLLQYSNDLLSSCDDHGILFTAGTLDTIGAWYLQHIVHYRRDVTVVPVGLLAHPWFVLSLAERERIVVQCIDVGMERIDICNGTLPDSGRGPLRIPLIARGETPAPDRLSEYPAFDPVLRRSHNFTPASLRWVTHLLEENRFKRPVHFSLPAAAKLFSSIPAHCTLCGLTYAVRPGREEKVDCEIGEQILSRALPQIGPDRRQFLQTREADTVIMQYALLCKKLADTRHRQGDYARERSLLHWMKDLADSCVILDAEAYDLLLQQRAGSSESPDGLFQ